MGITRSQMPKQIEGKLRGARTEKKQEKKKLQVKKPYRKNALSRTFTVKPRVIQSKKLYNRNEEKLYTLKVATKNYDEND